MSDKKELKLYVWTWGTCTYNGNESFFAIARSCEEARDLIEAKIGKRPYELDDFLPDIYPINKPIGIDGR